MFRIIYVLCIGLLLGITATATLSHFNPAPIAPTYPQELSTPPTPEGNMSYSDTQKKYDDAMKSYNSQSSKFNLTINLMKIGIAVLLVVLGGLLFGKVPFVGESFAAGGLLILLGVCSSMFVSFYAFDTTSNVDGSFKITMEQLAVLYAATVAALAVGYWTFRNTKKG